MRISPEEVARLLHRAVDHKVTVEALAQGLPDPGATGIVFHTGTEALGEKGEKIILVRPETAPMPGIVHGVSKRPEE